MHHDFVRIHQTTRCTPAMAAGVFDHPSAITASEATLKDKAPAPRPSPPRGSAGVGAVDRALGLLNCFKDGNAVLTLTQLAEATGLYKSTVLRLAASLERSGFLVRRADKAWRPMSEGGCPLVKS